MHEWPLFFLGGGQIGEKWICLQYCIIVAAYPGTGQFGKWRKQ
jgi:hypothetical protein